MEKKSVLIVGLGNPGSRYEITRHNVGHAVIAAYAKDFGWKFVRERELEGNVVSGRDQDRDVHLLFPTTYMNLSGSSVKKALCRFSVGLEDLLVVTDDVYLPFGTFRLRENGSSGGHNGLKSIEAHLGTKEFARLRVGIGEPFMCSLEEYVLSDFTEEELKKMPEVLMEAKLLLGFWIKRDIGAIHGFIAEKSSMKNSGESQ